MKSLGRILRVMGFAIIALVMMVSQANAVEYCTKAGGRQLEAVPGYGSIWAGFYSCNGYVGPCIDFLFARPNHDGRRHEYSKVPGMTQRKSDMLAYVVGSKDYSPECIAFAAWQLKGGARFDAYLAANKRYDKNVAVRACASRAIDQAALKIGMKLNVKLAVVDPGKTGRGYVKVTGTGNKPIKGIKVRLSSRGAGKLTAKSAMSNAAGKAKFSYRVRSHGNFRVTATVRAVNTGRIIITNPSAGRQHTVQVPLKKKLKAHASFRTAPNRSTIETVCDTDCDGNATVTFTYCNRGDRVVRRAERVGGAVIAQYTVKAGECGGASAAVTDGSKIQSGYCYLKKGQSSCRYTWQTGLYEVVCPAWLETDIQIRCTCKPERPTVITLRTPTGTPRYNLAWIKVGDNAPLEYRFAPGSEPRTVDLGNLKAGTRIVVSGQATRDNRYNESGGQVLTEQYVLGDVTINK